MSKNYGKLDELSGRVAARLIREGVRTGDSEEYEPAKSVFLKDEALALIIYTSGSAGNVNLLISGVSGVGLGVFQKEEEMLLIKRFTMQIKERRHLWQNRLEEVV